MRRPEPAAADDDLHAWGGLRVAIPIRRTAQTNYDPLAEGFGQALVD